jgi:TnpA family transposase
VVFGLAHLLGIRLMPRIRNWKDLTPYRPTPESRYKHINALFRDDVDWELIETHVPDLLRIVLSVKNGTITASTILGKLNTYSHKKIVLANWPSQAAARSLAEVTSVAKREGGVEVGHSPASHWTARRTFIAGAVKNA